MSTEKATSLRRGLDIMLALGDRDGANAGLGVVRLAELLGSEKSAVSRTLRTLLAYNLVERDEETLAYRLGPRFFALASRVGDQRLFNEANVPMERLLR